MFSYDLLNIPENLSLRSSKIEELLKRLEEEVPHPQNGTINIAYITDEEMQTLNREYREKDQTTDVLSFHYFDEFALVKGEEVAGEIVMSVSKIASQAEEHGHSAEDETYILILHWLLHILGYDHESDDEYEVMWKYEKKIRESLWLTAL